MGLMGSNSGGLIGGSGESESAPRSSHSSVVHCMESSEDVLTVIYDQTGNAFTHGGLCEYVNHLVRENARLKKTVEAGNVAIRQLEKAVEHRNDCRKCGGTLFGMVFGGKRILRALVETLKETKTESKLVKAPITRPAAAESVRRRSAGREQKEGRHE